MFRTVLPILATALLFATHVLPAQPRIWTDLQGRTITATLEKVDGENVVIFRDDGQRFTVPATTFSTGDQAYIREWALKNPPPLEPVRWPRKVNVSSVPVEIVREQDGEFIYRTEHFEFHSDVRLSRTLVSRFGEIFEATFLAVQELPIGYDPQAPEAGHFQTRLFSTVGDFHQAGGVRGSAGTYMPATKEILVPLEYLGVRRSSSGFTFDRHRQSSTLIHEITHQVMDQWIRRIPAWLTEGSAEYIESIPYDRGSFLFQQYDLARFLSAYGTEITIVPLETLLATDRSAWNEAFRTSRDTVSRNYLTAFLLTYYFYHLDGENDAARIRRYLASIHQGLPESEAAETHLLDGRTIAELENDMIRAYSRQRVKISTPR